MAVSGGVQEPLSEDVGESEHIICSVDHIHHTQS